MFRRIQENHTSLPWVGEILNQKENGVRIFKGIATKINAKYIVLETNMVISLHVATLCAYSGQVNQEAQIYVHQVVRRRPSTFYDFRQKMRKSSFSVWFRSGIGPVSARHYRWADDNAGLFKQLKPRTSPTWLSPSKKSVRNSPADGAGLGRQVVVAGDDLSSHKIVQCKQALKTKNWKKPWRPCWLWECGNRAQENQEILLKERQIQLRTIKSALKMLVK